MFKKPLLSLALLASTVFAAACGDTDAPMGADTTDLKPELQAFFSTAPAPGMSVLNRTVTLGQDYSDSGEFEDDESGWLRVPEAGIEVYIPEGALADEEDITLTALAGDAVAFEFAPHGLTFLKPIKVRVNVTDTEAEYMNGLGLSNGAINDAIGVYYEYDANGQAVPLENFQIYWNNGWLEFWTNHFSGYAIAM